MIQVNPPTQVRLPVDIEGNLSLKKAFQDSYFIMSQLWTRSGAGQDFSTTPIKVTDSDYTSSIRETVIVTASKTITCSLQPLDGQTLIVKRKTTAGNVTVSGNGKTIDGATTFVLTVNYQTVSILYSSELGEWLIM
jgi:hypothetical protein